MTTKIVEAWVRMNDEKGEFICSNAKEKNLGEAVKQRCTASC